jgi:NAD(P)-dependent dehydrogenase (short-subunit alcohol dehydrogenase family)
VSGRLEGKRCLVTGAASGIGRAIAEEFASEGALVAGLDRDEVDVADEASVERAVAESAERLGGVDVLVNCAGILVHGTVVATALADWESVFAVNARGTFLMSRAAIPRMSAGGSVINIASNYGIVGGREAAAYSASKGAVVALTRSMALDHAPGVRVNCVCPGTVDTPMIGEPRVTESRLARHPMGRLGEPRDVAVACVYLASDEAAWVTGSVFPVDGGYTAQ